MRSSSYPTLMKDENSKKQIISFIENFIIQNPKYYSLSGQWQFSEKSHQWNNGNHLYLYLKGTSDYLSFFDLSRLMRELIVDISEKWGSPSLKKELTDTLLLSSVECNIISSPYFVRILPGKCVDVLIACGSEKYQKEAFLEGINAKDSTIHKYYISHYMYEPHTLKNIFQFFESSAQVEKKASPSKDDAILATTSLKK